MYVKQGLVGDADGVEISVVSGCHGGGGISRIGCSVGNDAECSRLGVAVVERYIELAGKAALDAVRADIKASRRMRRPLVLRWSGLGRPLHQCVRLRCCAAGSQLRRCRTGRQVGETDVLPEQEAFVGRDG